MSATNGSPFISRRDRARRPDDDRTRNAHRHVNGRKYTGAQSTVPSSQASSSTWSVPSSSSSVTRSGTPATNTSLNEIRTSGRSDSIRQTPFFFREKYAEIYVARDCAALAVKPRWVNQADWLAHQVVEQVKLFRATIALVLTIDRKSGLALCNTDSCPTMSAATHIYRWPSDQTSPANIPAPLYLQLIDQWLDRKVKDRSLFPEADGYPVIPIEGLDRSIASVCVSHSAGSQAPPTPSSIRDNYESEFQEMYKQMMRCYAHVYHNHWLEPFWDLNAYRELNDSFLYFVTVSRIHRLLRDADMEPMQPLIDLWQRMRLLPRT